jgi:probable HAF family extracellular repeat protein
MYKPVILSLAIASSVIAAPAEIRNLGNISGTLYSRAEDINAEDINDVGDVVGYAQNMPSTSQDRAVFWPASGAAMQNLGTFNGLGVSRATAVNNAGVTVGWADGYPYVAPASGYERGFSRAPSGSVTSIGAMSGSYSRAQAINGAGDIAGLIGYSSASVIEERAFLRRASDAAVIELPRPPAALASRALDLNSARDVVGTFNLSSSVEQAFLWRESSGDLIELGTLGGTTSRAEAINAPGDIVGYARDAAGTHRAFLRRAADGVMQPLEVPDGRFTSAAYDINDSGIVVGAATFAGGIVHASLWDSQARLVDLDAWLDQVNPAAGAFWTLNSASAINAAGFVAGTGIYNDGPGGLTDGTRAFVLDASSVPEPTTALLVPLAILVMHRARKPFPVPSPLEGEG